MTTQTNTLSHENKAKPSEAKAAKATTALTSAGEAGKPEGETKPVNAFAARLAERANKGDEKVKVVTEVKQRLAEAYDAFNSGDDRLTEANQIADKAGVKLYQAQADGSMTADEVTAIIGDVFGYQKKGASAFRVTSGDPEASKTPFGKGNTLRQRIVRMVNASDYVESGADIGFFGTMPEEATEEVESVIAAVDSGDMSIFRAYDRFAEIKRAHVEKVPFAFDPAKIASLSVELLKAGAIDRIAKSDALRDEYATLLEVIQTVGDGIAAIDAKE